MKTARELAIDMLEANEDSAFVANIEARDSEWLRLVEEAQAETKRVREELAREHLERIAVQDERDACKALINAPEIIDFAKAVQLEAAHQRARWGSDHDAGKTDADWFWLLGYLGGKALRADDGVEKQLHRIITVAAAACNWHAAKLGLTNMRPGIDTPAGMPPDDFGVNTKVPVLR